MGLTYRGYTSFGLGRTGAYGWPRHRLRKGPRERVRPLEVRNETGVCHRSRLGVITVPEYRAFGRVLGGTIGGNYCLAWPRDKSSGPHGGLSTGPGGGLSTSPGVGTSSGHGGGRSVGPGGGLSTGPGGGLSTGAGGGLSTGPGGGLSTGPGGGLSTSGPRHYTSNVPPWPRFVLELERRGMKSQADIIRKHHLN